MVNPRPKIPPATGAGVSVAAETGEDAACEGGAGDAAVAKSAKSKHRINIPIALSLHCPHMHTVGIHRRYGRDSRLCASEEPFDKVCHNNRGDGAKR